MQEGTTIYGSRCEQAVEMQLVRLRTKPMHYPGFSFEVLSYPHSHGYTVSHDGDDKTQRGHPVELVRYLFWCYHQISQVSVSK